MKANVKFSPLQKSVQQEELTEDRKLQTVIEQVMVDQLSRAVISDPEQNAVSVSPMSVPPRYRRTLNHTKWNALHFIARGVYLNRGRPYCPQDISQGAELHFCADGPHLPQSLRQQPCLTLRVTDVDNTAKGALLTQSGETLHRLSEEEIHDRNALKEIQGTVHDGPS
ncbi:calcyphosin-2-like isoform X2 [Cyprinus carpio]|uniref:Calcyphosin-2-like isoform X2 n=1 Tax=Cyprinus carpio TaxID=7962 RepID=A0A9Q9Z3W2_CYPCA|nr:calcyphosin-2-like isoform X2 [Cyprinus carpio]